jgi:hypothetical protein
MRTGWNRSVRYIESKPRSTGQFVACRGAQPLASEEPLASVPPSAATAHPKILPLPALATSTFSRRPQSAVEGRRGKVPTQSHLIVSEDCAKAFAGGSIDSQWHSACFLGVRSQNLTHVLKLAI